MYGRIQDEEIVHQARAFYIVKQDGPQLDTEGLPLLFGDNEGDTEEVAPHFMPKDWRPSLTPSRKTYCPDEWPRTQRTPSI